MSDFNVSLKIQSSSFQNLENDGKWAVSVFVALYKMSRVLL